MDNSIGFVLLCLSGILVFIGQGIFYMVMLIMLTNTIEYDEWQTGERNDAVTFSVRPFVVKLAGAIQYLVVSVALVLCGLYSLTTEIGKVEQQINNNVISKDAGKVLIDVILNKVTDGQMIGLTLFMCLVPVVSYVLSYFIIKKKYIIDEELYDTMIKEIALRKESQ